MTLTLKNSKRIHANHDDALKELRSEKIDKITINVTQSLKKNFRSKALKNDTSMTTLLINYIKQYASDGNKTELKDLTTTKEQVEKIKEQMKNTFTELEVLQNQFNK